MHFHRICGIFRYWNIILEWSTVLPLVEVTILAVQTIQFRTVDGLRAHPIHTTFVVEVLVFFPFNTIAIDPIFGRTGADTSGKWQSDRWYGSRRWRWYVIGQFHDFNRTYFGVLDFGREFN